MPMYSLYRTLSVRYLGRRWFRALLIVASIALGVATLVATRTLNDTMATAIVASNNPLAGLVDFIVTSGELTLPSELAREVAAVPGVRSAQAWVWNNARLRLGEERRSVLVIGVDLAKARKLAGGAEEITLSPGTEAAFGLAKLAGKMAGVVGKELANVLPAQTAMLELERNRRPFPIVKAGSITATGNWAMLSGYVVILDQHDAAEVLGYPKGHVNRIDVLLASDAKADQVRAAIEARLAGRAHVKTPAEQNQAIGSAMDSFRAGFSLCGVAALVVGMFLVYNALSVTVAERRHEIGILLALGATRRQVLALFAGEAALLGLAGAIIGIPFGLALAYLGLQPMQAVLADLYNNLHAHQVEITPQLIMIAVAAGVVATVGAALVPAIQASQENPAEAVRRVPKAPTARHLIFLAIAALSLLTAGALMTVGRDRLPRQWGTFGGLSLVLVAALVASPLCATLAAVALRPLARRYFRIEWRLAADNLLQSPGRTGMVIGALAAGVSLVMQTAGVIQSNRAALRTWIEGSIAADVIITGGSSLGSGDHGEPMDQEVSDALAGLAEVEGILPLRLPKVEFRGDSVLLLVLDAGLAGRMHAARIAGGGEAALFRTVDAAPDGALASENFAARYGVHPGDTITLPSNSGPVTLRIVGTIEDYSWVLGTLYVNRREYVEHWQDTRADMIDVYVKPGYTATEVKEKIAARFGARYGLFPATRLQLVDDIDRIIERVHGIAYGQQIVVMLVAGLGVITSLLISVLQRRREMGLLRAIGAPQAQVIHSVLAEACLMGALGTALGVLFGIPLEWFVLKVVIFEESGFLFPVHIPWTGALLIALIAIATATLAGLGPAMYSVRQRIPEAIAYE
jgi:putative ABC transport system permease protein